MNDGLERSFNPLFIRGKMQDESYRNRHRKKRGSSFNPLFIRGKMQDNFFSPPNGGGKEKFQSLIHQGKNARRDDAYSSSFGQMQSFNPLFIRGKMQDVPVGVNLDAIVKEFQSLIHQGKNASGIDTNNPKRLAQKFQSLIHQGKNASKSALIAAELPVLRFQSLIHQGKNARALQFIREPF